MGALQEEEGQYDYNNYCPSCGEFDKRILEEEGWCADCVSEYKSPLCRHCEDKLSDPSSTICNSCKREMWLARNADELERYINEGLPVYKAIRQVFEDNRPFCICCGQPIYGGKSSALFCKRSASCRSAQRRYRTLQGGSYQLPPYIALTQLKLELRAAKG